MQIKNSFFVKSSEKISQCPQDGIAEIAFIGRSNVGKSSIINMITNKKKLAKSSNTPGKTQHINHFMINDERYLVDLPGYGYAKSGMENRKKRLDMIQEYLTQSSTIKNIFLLIDGNINPQKIDVDFIKELEQNELPYDIIITKIDKSTQKQININVKNIIGKIHNITNSKPNIILSSAIKKKGLDQILEIIKKKIYGEQDIKGT